MLELNKVYHGDCLEVMKDIDDESIDMVMADPPYQITQCHWDSIIPLEPMWVQLKRVIKSNGAIVLMGSQPFTTTLISSNIEMFKYEWIWKKSNPSNIALVNKQPLKYHENIVLFYQKQPTYNKQMIERDELGKKRLQNKNNPIRFSGSEQQGKKGFKKDYDINRYDVETKNPSSVLEIKVERGKFHPTQKPVALMEYLIKTYTNEGDLVLDFCAGSGTTGVACRLINRNFIMIEKEQEYITIIKQRLANPDYKQPKQKLNTEQGLLPENEIRKFLI